MARPQAQDYELRRLAIVNKAADLFATRGFNAASVSELADACKISKSNIYHYFPSKEDILFEVMSSHIDLLVSDTEQVLGSNGTALEQFSALIHAFLGHYVGAGSRQKVLLNELAHLPEPQRSDIVAKQRSLIEAVQRLLTAIHPDLAADPKRARVQTMLIFGMINWAHTWYNPTGPIKVETLAAMVLQTIGVEGGGRRRESPGQKRKFAGE